MKRTRTWSCVVVVFCLCSVFATAEKPESPLVLKDPDMTISNPEAQALTFGFHCGISARGVLTGYCLGARSGMCRAAYDPTHCPPPDVRRRPRRCGSVLSSTINTSTSRRPTVSRRSRRIGALSFVAAPAFFYCTVTVTVAVDRPY
jgi:hypothetical protein